MDEQGIDLVLTQVIPNRFQIERNAWREPEIGRTGCELLLSLTKTYVFSLSSAGAHGWGKIRYQNGFQCFCGCTYLRSVAAGVPPAVEPGILPGVLSCELCRHFRVQSSHSGRQDAALYGSQDGCRYSRKPTLNRYIRFRSSAARDRDVMEGLTLDSLSRHCCGA